LAGFYTFTRHAPADWAGFARRVDAEMLTTGGPRPGAAAPDLRLRPHRVRRASRRPPRGARTRPVGRPLRAIRSHRGPMSRHTGASPRTSRGAANYSKTAGSSWRADASATTGRGRFSPPPSPSAIPRARLTAGANRLLRDPGIGIAADPISSSAQARPQSGRALEPAGGRPPCATVRRAWRSRRA
jgi:hypothetical protein